MSRSSTRLDFAAEGIARTAVVRLSIPQVALIGAHAPGTVRLYELTVGQNIAISSGMYRHQPGDVLLHHAPMTAASSVANRLHRDAAGAATGSGAGGRSSPAASRSIWP